MGRCNTVDDGEKWKSKVNGANDGLIQINREESDGTFTGTHEDSGHHLTGRCREQTGRPHKIRFEVPENGHLYVGVFVGDDNRKIEGLRLNLNDVRNFAGGDEDWVAVKGT